MAEKEKPKFTLKEEHIRLIGRLNFKVYPDTEYNDPFIPEIDRKRPFGNSDALHDVLDILECERDEEGCCSAEDVDHAEDLLVELPLALEVIVQNRTFTPGTYEVEGYGTYSNYRMMRNYKVLKGVLSEIRETLRKTGKDRRRVEMLRTLCMNVMEDDPWRIIKDIKCQADADPECAKFREVLKKHRKLAQNGKPTKAGKHAG